MHASKPHKNYTYETQRAQGKKCNLINFRDVSPDSRNQNIRKFYGRSFENSEDLYQDQKSLEKSKTYQMCV